MASQPETAHPNPEEVELLDECVDLSLFSGMPSDASGVSDISNDAELNWFRENDTRGHLYMFYVYCDLQGQVTNSDGSLKDNLPVQIIDREGAIVDENHPLAKYVNIVPITTIEPHPDMANVRVHPYSQEDARRFEVKLDEKGHWVDYEEWTVVPGDILWDLHWESDIKHELGVVPDTN